VVTEQVPAEPATVSEGTLPVSTEEPTNPPPQEPAPTSEGSLDEFWQGLSPEARLEFARRLSAEELRAHPTYEEALRRDQQSQRDREMARTRRQRELEAQEQAIKTRQQTAETKLRQALRDGNGDVLPIAREWAEATAAAEYYPSMRDEILRAVINGSHYEHMTQEERWSLEERQPEWGQQASHVLKVYGEAVARITNETAEKRFEANRKSIEAAAMELGRRQVVRETRGEVPPRSPGGGIPLKGMSFVELQAAYGSGVDKDGKPTTPEMRSEYLRQKAEREKRG